MKRSEFLVQQEFLDEASRHELFADRLQNGQTRLWCKCGITGPVLYGAMLPTSEAVCILNYWWQLHWQTSIGAALSKTLRLRADS